MASTVPPHIHILGAGSLGLLFASYIKRFHSSARITFLLRNAESVAMFNRCGGAFSCHEIVGGGPTREYSLGVDAIALEPNLDQHKPVDRVASIEHLLCCTKAPQLFQALSLLLSNTHPSLAVNPSTGFYLIQNGIGVDETLQSVLGFSNPLIMVGTTTEAAYRDPALGRFRVHHATTHGKTFFALHPSSITVASSSILMPSVKHVIDALEAELVPYSVLSDKLFTKLSLNAVINPTSAIYNIRNGDIILQPRSLMLARALAAEVTSVLVKKGIWTTERGDSMWNEVEKIAEATADNWSSMAQDVRAGRETEVDWINGSIIKMGKEVGVKVERNEWVVEEIKKITKTGTAERA